MTRRVRTRRRWENRAGWWGVVAWSAAATTAAVAVTALAWLAGGGAHAGLSALLGGGAVLVLSAVTGLTTALAWDHARAAVMPIAMGVFVVKLVAFGVLLGMVPRPGWLVAEAAGVAALVGVVIWQTAEVLVFARTRRGVYTG